MCVHACVARGNVSSCSLVRVQQIIPLGGTHRFHFDLMMEGKKERERERERGRDPTRSRKRLSRMVQLVSLNINSRREARNIRSSP